MRKTYITFLILAAIPVLFFSCNKETNDNIDVLEKYNVDNPDANSWVKFIHAYTPLTINTLNTSLATTSTGFRITMDGIKLNGVSNTSSSTNSFRYGGQPDTATYSSSFYPTTTTYSFLSPGYHNFKFIMNRIVSGNYAPTTADEVFSTTQTLVAGKKYSMFIADPYPAPTALMVEDNFKEPIPNAYGIRFINVCGDASSRFDVVSTRHGIKVFSNVGYKEMKDFIYLGTTTRDTFYLRDAGTTTVVGQVNFTPGTQRVYTLYARGKTGVTGRLPGINYYTNR